MERVDWYKQKGAYTQYGEDDDDGIYKSKMDKMKRPKKVDGSGWTRNAEGSVGIVAKFERTIISVEPW